MKPNADDRFARQSMIDALQLLAAPAAEQVAALPSFVVVADEVALTFEDALHTCSGKACDERPPRFWRRSELGENVRECSTSST